MSAVEIALLRFVNEDLLSGLQEVQIDDEFVLDGTVDSFGVTRLIGFVETEFSIKVPAEDVTIENFRTVATMAEYLRQRIEPEPVA